MYVARSFGSPPGANFASPVPSLASMSTVINDLKLSIRQLARRPVFALTAVLTLAVGMGVNAVAFTLVNGLLVRGLEVRRSPDLGRILSTPGGDETGNASLAEYQRFVEATRDVLDVAAEGRLSVAWRQGDASQTAWVLFVSSGYFSMVTVHPLAGRINVASAVDGTPAVVIGERFWRRKLGGGPIDGLTLRLNDRVVSVSGVIPESFTGPAGLYSPDVWLPLEDLALFRTAAALEKRDARWLFILARLKPGVTTTDVQGRLDAAAAAMADDWPDTHRRRGARFRLFREGNSEIGALSRAAAIGMGTIGVVLLLACFNVTNLLLARAIERERDMGIRAAIGASRSRLIRLVVTEGFLIAGLAGAVAFVPAWWTQALLGSFAIPIDVPQHIDLSPDATVVAFIVLLVLVAGVLPGLWPALAAARVDVLQVLRRQGGHAGSGRPSPLRQWLVAAQVAGSTAFLTLAALFIQSYAKQALQDPGFDRDHLIVADVSPSSHGYDASRSEQYALRLVDRVRALPGVAAVTIADRAPFFIGFDRSVPVSSPREPCEGDACPQYPVRAVAPGYFGTMGIRLAAGREFTGAEPQSAIIVNQPLVERFWPDGGALGQTVRVGEAVATVVGITARTQTRRLDGESPTIYVPLSTRHFNGSVALMARTAGSPQLLTRPIVDAANALDPDVPLQSVKTMEERMAVQLWPFRTISWLFAICGSLALVLATLGLASVVIHAINRRRREFGVRVSVGATPRDVAVDVLRGSGRLLVPGLVAGMIVAAGGARLLQALFVGIDLTDPLAYVGVASLQAVTVLIACVGPALRAARVDPVVALRAD